jgi:CRISPR-associated endonuclease Cas1
MAASKTVSQLLFSRNSTNPTTPSQVPASIAVPRSGVVTLFGYGINVRLDRGHLFAEDGIGRDRRTMRLPRVGHGLRRLIVIGSDGTVSLAALRWLADQDASFVMLDRDGSVLATTGPVRPSDARLRRAQAMAGQLGVGLEIAKELISRKLAGQEEIARYKLRESATAMQIAQLRSAIATVESIPSLRRIEAQAAAAYWSAWSTLPVTFPKNDLNRVPEHWRTFGSRTSPLTGSPRLAANPANAILNYLYTVLESEARLAAATLGLDPGLGFLHLDTPARDSLANDLMEPIRANVDGYVLNWILEQPLRREWFFEQRDGNCRLMAPFAVRLSDTAPMWARAVAPLAEWVAKHLWRRKRTPEHKSEPPTRLTQTRRREAQGGPQVQSELTAPRRRNICRGCGKTLTRGRDHCAQCAVSPASERLVDVARLGRAVAHTPEARAREGQKQRQHAEARNSWTPSDKPAWLTSQNLRRENSALTRQAAKLSYCVTHQGLSLVCRAHPSRLSCASPALAGTGGAGGDFRNLRANFVELLLMWLGFLYP